MGLEMDLWPGYLGAGAAAPAALFAQALSALPSPAHSEPSSKPVWPRVPSKRQVLALRGGRRQQREHELAAPQRGVQAAAWRR